MTCQIHRNRNTKSSNEKILTLPHHFLWHSSAAPPSIQKASPQAAGTNKDPMRPGIQIALWVKHALIVTDSTGTGICLTFVAFMPQD